MKVLFICRGNVGRSQMAEALYNKYSKRNSAISCGAKNYYYRRFWHSKIKKNYPPVKTMADVGIDISKNKIKKLTRGMVASSGIVIALMQRNRAEHDLPLYVKKSGKYRLWEIKDVMGTVALDSKYEMHCKNRDKILALVKKLVRETG